MDFIFNRLNRLSFLIAPVFWNLVYRSLIRAVAGACWLFVTKRLLKKVMSPYTVFWGTVLMLEILVLPFGKTGSDYSVMQVFEPVQFVSYRQEYDMYESRYFIARQDEETEYNGVPDAVLKEKTDRRYIKSLICDVALPLIWLGGTAAGFLWLIYSGVKLDREVTEKGRAADKWLMDIYEENIQLLKMKNDAEVIVTDIVSVPAVAGLFRNKILLPPYVESMDRQTAANILIHEQRHIKQKDLLLNFCMLAIQTVYWFNPVVVRILKYQRQETEILTDYNVLDKTGMDKEYMHAMVRVLANNTEGAVSSRIMCMTDSAINIKQRIEYIKRRKNYKKSKLYYIFIGALISTLFSMLMVPDKADRPPQFSYTDEYGAMAVEKFSSIGVQGMNIQCRLPWNWQAENNQLNPRPETDVPVPPGEFDYVVDIYQDGEFIGYLGFAQFEPYTDEIPQEEYHKTVWPGMRLSSMVSWDPFTAIKQTDNGETGIVEIRYADYRHSFENPDTSAAALPQYESDGILAYNRNDCVYAGFAFLPDKVSENTLMKIAESVSLTSGNKNIVESMSVVYRKFVFDRNGRKFSCGMPENWSIRQSDTNVNSSDLLTAGYYENFESVFGIFDGDELIGHIGVNNFTPPMEEMRSEDYCGEIFTGINKSSFFTWDNFRTVSAAETGTCESGTAEVSCSDGTESLGVWAYNTDKEFYVCIGFVPGASDSMLTGRIADNIEFYQ